MSLGRARGWRRGAEDGEGNAALCSRSRGTTTIFRRRPGVGRKRRTGRMPVPRRLTPPPDDGICQRAAEGIKPPTFAGASADKPAHHTARQCADDGKRRGRDDGTTDHGTTPDENPLSSAGSRCPKQFLDTTGLGLVQQTIRLRRLISAFVISHSVALLQTRGNHWNSRNLGRG
jgi:hypothetical protein